MAMAPLTIRIQPRSAFGGSIRGDTLLGQLCWIIRHRFGEDRLRALLQGYTEGKPFLVVSDAFPAGFLPKPAWPLYRYDDVSDADRKQVKKRQWLPKSNFELPVREWLRVCKSETEIADTPLWQEKEQPHNTINRLSGTTGTDLFAPYQMPQYWPTQGMLLEIYLCFDAERICQEDIVMMIEDIGTSGYGRDVSIGMGKFDLLEKDSAAWPVQKKANAWMTLAPCASQGLPLDVEHCWYQPFTRFGRHGDMAVHTGRPFKSPVLLVDTGAFLTPKEYQEHLFVGHGLGGDGSLSHAISETVQQGYAPVLAIHLEVDA